MIDQFSVIDLFCGVGGLTHGFQNIGFDVVAGIDFDKSCKYAYETNNNSSFKHRDISNLKSSEIELTFPEGKRKILIGCAPCQPFSVFNKKNSATITKENDQRWRLLYDFSQLIKSVRPEIISMENVPFLKSFREGKVLNDFVKTLEEEGYHISCNIFDAQYYGVPQRRQRLVLLGSLHGKIEMIPYTHSDKTITVREVIGDLPKIEAGEISNSDPLHRSRKLQDLNLTRIKSTPEGGGWEDWEEELVSECHKRESGKGFGSAYGRMSWDTVAPTMTTYCTGYNNGRFGHPDQDRAISIREAALIQSFPTDYDFINPNVRFSLSRIAKHVGNAVPVLLGEAIARSVEKHIQEISDE